jgi:predicted Fe-S protein YdhL (DUF1289 family)
LEKKIIKLSPCVSICKYNKNNYCIGCKRHEDEIRSWVDLSTEMKLAIMKDLKDREID